MVFPLTTLRCKSAQGVKGKCVYLLRYLLVVEPVGSHVALGASIAIRYAYGTSCSLIPVRQDAILRSA